MQFLKNHSFQRAITTLATSTILSAVVHAQPVTTSAVQPQEILVFGSNFNLRGTPVSASEGVVF